MQVILSQCSSNFFLRPAAVQTLYSATLMYSSLLALVIENVFLYVLNLTEIEANLL